MTTATVLKTEGLNIFVPEWKLQVVDHHSLLRMYDLDPAPNKLLLYDLLRILPAKAGLYGDESARDRLNEERGDVDISSMSDEMKTLRYGHFPKKILFLSGLTGLQQPTNLSAPTLVHHCAWIRTATSFSEEINCSEYFIALKGPAT